MTFLGVLITLGLAVVSAAIAALMLVGGYRSFREELQPGFRISPPGPRSVLLTALGVLLPIAVIVIFTTLLTIVLLQIAFTAAA